MARFVCFSTVLSCLLSISACSGGEAPATTCETSDQCLGGQVCQAGQCVNVGGDVDRDAGTDTGITDIGSDSIALEVGEDGDPDAPDAGAEDGDSDADAGADLADAPIEDISDGGSDTDSGDSGDDLDTGGDADADADGDADPDTPDCDGVIGGAAVVDDCGVCAGGTTGLEPNADEDECGVCFGDGPPTWYDDTDGDDLGDPNPDLTTVACEQPEGYADNADDAEPDCSSNDTDVCGVCGGPGEITWYGDDDEDGLGDPDDIRIACDQPEGYVANSSDGEPDCQTNDTDVCGVCAGPGEITWYDDSDDDGLGDPAMSLTDCEQPEGYVANADDAEPACQTNDTDVCDVCAGPGLLTWYDDSDDDGLGDPDVTQQACDQPEGYVANADDDEPQCQTNDTDNCGVCGGDGEGCLDCAGVLDGEAIVDDCGVCSGGTTGLEPNADQDVCGICFGDGPPTWYEDADDDGLGDPAVTDVDCEQPDGFVANADDTEPNCQTNDTDICGVCAGPGELTWYEDADDDGLGDPDVTLVDCEQPDGYVANANDDEPDCQTNDTDICGVCAGPGLVTWYEDADDDGLGDPAQSLVACAQPDGYVLNADDTEPNCQTNDTDVCGVCGGPGELTWYEDADDDGLGDPAVTDTACEQPEGFVANADDTEPNCQTNDTDICGVCAGPGELTWYEDADDDGLGDPAVTDVDCEQPEGFVANADDTEPNCQTNDTDICGVCAGPGELTWYEDADDDGLGDPDVSQQDCEQPDGYVDNADDTEPGCQTNDTDICGVCAGDGYSCLDCTGVPFGGAVRDCAGICEGTTADGPAYVDADHDHYGSTTEETVCLVGGLIPPGYSAVSTDCDDADALRQPGAVEIPGDGVDNDCLSGDLTLDDTTAVFVDVINGSDQLGDGSPQSPLATVTAGVGLADASENAVAVVVAYGYYDEAFDLLQPTTSILGGYDHDPVTDAWSYDPDAASTILTDSVGVMSIEFAADVSAALDGVVILANQDSGSSVRVVSFADACQSARVSNSWIDVAHDAASVLRAIAIDGSSCQAMVADNVIQVAAAQPSGVDAVFVEGQAVALRNDIHVVGQLRRAIWLLGTPVAAVDNRVLTQSTSGIQIGVEVGAAADSSVGGLWGNVIEMVGGSTVTGVRTETNGGVVALYDNRLNLTGGGANIHGVAALTGAALTVERNAITLADLDTPNQVYGVNANVDTLVRAVNNVVRASTNAKGIGLVIAAPRTLLAHNTVLSDFRSAYFTDTTGEMVLVNNIMASSAGGDINCVFGIFSTDEVLRVHGNRCDPVGGEYVWGRADTGAEVNECDWFACATASGNTDGPAGLLVDPNPLALLDGASGAINAGVVPEAIDGAVPVPVDIQRQPRPVGGALAYDVGASELDSACGGGAVPDCQGLCDGTARLDCDDLCNGLAFTGLWFADPDMDGNGDPNDALLACAQPEDYVSTLCETDVCGVCDGPGQLTWYDDFDDDGLGDPAISVDECVQPAGYVDNADDLDVDNDLVDDDGDGSGTAGDNPCTSGFMGCDDNCPYIFNRFQMNTDGDDFGDRCDDDDDDDGILDDGDGSGTIGDNPCGDGVVAACDDNCQVIANSGQQNADDDADGDACDTCTDDDLDDWGSDVSDYSGCPNNSDPDCDDDDPDLHHDWLVAVDVDGDGYGAGSVFAQCLADPLPDGYAFEGGDCAPNDPLHWSDCGSCTDGDGDGRGSGCDLGGDCDDQDEDHWADCGSCQDADFDGYGPSCDLGTDCDDSDPLTYLGAFDIPDDGVDNDCLGDGDATRSNATGIFVADGCNGADDDNAGTMADPVQTIGRAIELAEDQGKIVFASNDLYFEDGVTTRVSMIGGYECYNGWARPGTWYTTLNSVGTGALKVRSMTADHALITIDGMDLGGESGAALDIINLGDVVISNSLLFTTDRATVSLDTRGGRTLIAASDVTMNGAVNASAVRIDTSPGAGGVPRVVLSGNAIQGGSGGTNTLRSTGVQVVTGLGSILLADNLIDGSVTGVRIGHEGTIADARATLVDNTIYAGVGFPPASGTPRAVLVEERSYAELRGNVIQASFDNAVQSTYGVWAWGQATVDLFENDIHGGRGFLTAYAVHSEERPAPGAIYPGGANLLLVSNRLWGGEGFEEGESGANSRALSLEGDTTSAIAVNNMFRGGQGGDCRAVYVDDATVDLVHNSMQGSLFTTPSVDTSSLYIRGSATVVAVNNAMNTGNGSGAREVVNTVGAASVTSINNNFHRLQGNVGDWCRLRAGANCLTNIAAVNAAGCDWAGCTETSGNFVANPMYSGGQLHIQAGSGLIGQAVNPDAWFSDLDGWVDTDFEGDARPTNNADVGRDELP